MSLTDYKVVENITDEGSKPFLQLKTQEEKDATEYSKEEILPLTKSETESKAFYSQFYQQHGRDFDPNVDTIN